MGKFKAMKFCINKESDIFDIVKASLIRTGYTFSGGIPVCLFLFTYEDGAVTWSNYDDGSDNEEINIDWMRTTKPETIELNGKTYIKTELEEALRHIKPVD